MTTFKAMEVICQPYEEGDKPRCVLLPMPENADPEVFIAGLFAAWDLDTIREVIAFRPRSDLNAYLLAFKWKSQHFPEGAPQCWTVFGKTRQEALDRQVRAFQKAAAKDPGSVRTDFKIMPYEQYEFEMEVEAA